MQAKASVAFAACSMVTVPTRHRCNLADVIAELMPVLELLAHAAARSCSSRSTERACPGRHRSPADSARAVHPGAERARSRRPRNGEPPSVRIDVTGDRYGVTVAVEDSGLAIADRGPRATVSPVLHDQGARHRLGLASSRAIVEAHEGSIGFETSQGGGTPLLASPACSVRQRGGGLSMTSAGATKDAEAQTGHLHRRR